MCSERNLKSQLLLIILGYSLFYAYPIYKQYIMHRPSAIQLLLPKEKTPTWDMVSWSDVFSELDKEKMENDPHQQLFILDRALKNLPEYGVPKGLIREKVHEILKKLLPTLYATKTKEKNQSHLLEAVLLKNQLKKENLKAIYKYVVASIDARRRELGGIVY